MAWVLGQGTQFWAYGSFSNLSNRVKIITGEHFKDIKASSSSPESLSNLSSANSAKNKVLCLINFYWNRIHAESFLFTIAGISLSTSKYPLVNITFLSLRLNFLPVLLSHLLLHPQGTCSINYTFFFQTFQSWGFHLASSFLLSKCVSFKLKNYLN